MKKILPFMIIIIELLCFCNTTIAMARGNTDTAEIQQEMTNSIDSNTMQQNQQDKIEETIGIEEIQKETLEIPEQKKMN